MLNSPELLHSLHLIHVLLSEPDLAFLLRAGIDLVADLVVAARGLLKLWPNR